MLGGLLFTCGGRGYKLYGEVGVEAKIFQEMIPGKGLSGFYGLGEIGPCVRAGAEESGGSEEQTEIMGFTSIYVLFYAPTNGSEAGGLSTNTIEWTSDTFVNYSERKIESLQRLKLW